MDQQTRILVVDDDPIVAESIGEFLSQEGYITATAGNGNEALELIDHANGGEEPGFGLVVADMNMPRRDGIDLLKGIRRKHESIATIMITGFGKIETAVEAIKLGAVDYLTKPIVEDELRIAVGRAVQHHTLLAENRTLKAQLNKRFGLDNLVGSNYHMQKIYDLIEAVAGSNTTVLINGESGTGKSMVARAIHTHSPRRAGPFVTFSCGAIPETLLESELFGHVKGAFTGADTDKVGKILSADEGTLFIDEINSATPALQLKMLRVLQEKQFEPVGSTRTTHVAVRFVLATNEPLTELVASGNFREDLFYRINVVNIQMPRLSERTSDIPLLVDTFLDRFGAEIGKQRRVSDEAMEVLKRHDWPGNVRELENAVERAVVLSRGPVIHTNDLPEHLSTSVSTATHSDSNGNGSRRITITALEDGWNPMPLSKAMEDPERQIILTALEANNWNRQVTARELDINRTTLYKKIKQYHLDQPG